MTSRTPSLRIVSICLILATIVAYLPIFGSTYVSLDDTLLITKNDIVQQLTLPYIIRAFTSYDPELYIPLTLFSFQLQGAIFGLSAGVSHTINLLLHLISTVLVLQICSRLAASRYDESDSVWIGTACALVFALHPLQSEAVAWAAARKDTLSGVLALGSIYQYLRYREHHARAYVWSICLFVLALLAKVSVLLLPIALLLIDASTGRRLERRSLYEKLPFFTASAVFLLIALGGKKSQITALGPIDSLFISLKGAVFYLQHLIWPSGLSVFYPQSTDFSLLDLDIFLRVIAVAGLLATAWLVRRRQPLVSLGITLYLLLLYPSAFNIWKNHFMYFASDRYVYLPIIGISLAIASLLVPRLQQRAAAFSALGLLWCGLTYAQARTWHDSESLYRQVLSEYPHSVHALNNLGSALYEKKQYDDAEQYYLQAIDVDPNAPQPYANLGRLYRLRGDMATAEDWFVEGINLMEKDNLLAVDLAAYYLLGALYEEMGRVDDAIGTFGEAAEVATESAEAQINYGIMLQKYQQPAAAKPVLLRAVELNPASLDARYRLAAVAAETGDIALAIEQLQIVIDHDPDYEKAAEHLSALKNFR